MLSVLFGRAHYHGFGSIWGNDAGALEPAEMCVIKDGRASAPLHTMGAGEKPKIVALMRFVGRGRGRRDRERE